MPGAIWQDRFRRLGLQRRIMLYVAIGLALMFTIGAYVGLLAINQATDLVYRERLGTAYTTATALDNNLQALAHHVGSVRSRLLKANSRQEWGEACSDLFAQLSDSSAFAFVRAQGLWLIDQGGEVQFAFPSPVELVPNSLPVGTQQAFHEPPFLHPAVSSVSPQFGTLMVPVKDDAGIVRWTVALDLAALSRDEPYFLSPSSTAQGSAASGGPSNVYGLEVLSPDGRVALTRKGGTPPGNVSPHLYILQGHAAQPRGPFVFLHRPKKGEKFPPPRDRCGPSDLRTLRSDPGTAGGCGPGAAAATAPAPYTV